LVIGTAQGGAQAGDEGNAVTAVVAVNVVNNEANARLGTSTSPTTAAGDISLMSNHIGITTTTAEGDTVAGNAAVGASLALAIPNEQSLASTDRDLTATGDVTFQANSRSLIDTDSIASVTGATPDDDVDGSDDDDGVNDQVDAQRDGTDELAADNSVDDSGSTNSPSAETSDGPVSVAAAISVNVIGSDAIANVGAVTLNVGGELTVASEHNVDAVSEANASATESSDAVGAAVALNLANVDNSATISGGAIVAADAITVTATMLEIGIHDQFHLFRTNAEALIAATAQLTMTDGPDAGVDAGELHIETVGQTESIVNTSPAEHGGGQGGDVGVGASFSLNVVNNDVTSEIQDGSIVLGMAESISVLANSNQRTNTNASAGAEGGKAISPAVSMSIVNNDAIARIGTGAQIDSAGFTTIQTTHRSDIDTNADAVAVGSDVGVGASVALAIVDENSSARLDRDLVSATNLTVQSDSDVASDIVVQASRVGNFDDAFDTDETADHQASGSSQSGVSSGSLPEASDATDTASSTSDSESGAESSGTGVAAAIGINVVDSTNLAHIGSGVSATAGNDLEVIAQRQLDLLTDATGTSLDLRSKTNVGAAVALNHATSNNDAILGSASVIQADNITVAARLDSSRTNDLQSHAASASGSSGENGIAGSVAINIAYFTNEAFVGGTADVTATNSISIDSDSNLGIKTLDGSLGAADNIGVGSAVAFSQIDTNTNAFIGAGAQVDAAGSLMVTATADLGPFNGLFVQDPFAFAAGSGATSGEVGVGGSTIVNVLTIDTQAYLADLTLINQRIAPGAAQDIVIQAHEETRVKNGAGGLGVGVDSVGVGAGWDVTVIFKTTEAFIGKQAVVDADRNITIDTHSVETMLSFSAAVSSGGSVGIAGASSVYVPDNDTRAFIDGAMGQGSAITAAGNLVISSNSIADIDLYAGVIGIGLDNASVGASNTTLSRVDTVEAFAGIDSSISAGGGLGLVIAATSTEDILTIAVGGAGSQAVGIAGSAAVNDIDETTRAFVDIHSDINATGSGLPDEPGILITAEDTTDLFGIVGAVGVGDSLGLGADSHHRHLYSQ
jgi:hypothetical protein